MLDISNSGYLGVVNILSEATTLSYGLLLSFVQSSLAYDELRFQYSAKPLENNLIII